MNVRVLLAALLVVSVAGAVWAHGYRTLHYTVATTTYTKSTGSVDYLPSGSGPASSALRAEALDGGSSKTTSWARIRPQWADPLAAGLLVIAILAAGTLLVSFGFRVRRDATPS